MTARTSSWVLLLAAALVAVFAGACSRKSDSDGVHVSVIDHIAIGGDRVTVRGGGQRAEIGADGAIAIDGKALTLSAEQQAAGREFYLQATGMKRDGAAIGKAGAAMAGQVLSTVVQDVRSGRTDQIEPNVEAQAAKLREQAMQVCRRVETLRQAQQRLTAVLPQFQPFARIKQGTGDECKDRG